MRLFYHTPVFHHIFSYCILCFFQLIVDVAEARIVKRFVFPCFSFFFNGIPFNTELACSEVQPTIPANEVQDIEFQLEDFSFPSVPFNELSNMGLLSLKLKSRLLHVEDDPRYAQAGDQCTVGRINCVFRVEEEQEEEGKGSGQAYVIKEIYSPLD